MAYPGYPPGGPAADPLWGYFSAVAGQDGQIDAEELQRCLSSGFPQKGFSKETCRIMIAMLDRDCSGKMGFSEFKELWTVLSQWHQTFMSFDRDRSGNIDRNEMNQALTAFGYRLSQQAFNILMGRYSVNGQVGFDDFIACSIKLRALTALHGRHWPFCDFPNVQQLTTAFSGDQFRARDVAQNGTATFQYDDFIQVAMKL